MYKKSTNSLSLSLSLSLSRESGFKLICLLMVFSLLGCQKDMEVPEILAADLVWGSGENYERSVITFVQFEEELGNYALFDNYREKFDAEPSETQDFLKSINTEKIIKLRGDSLTTYTLPVITDLQIENDRTFGNIVFILENETLFTGMVQYDPLQEWVDEFIIRGIEHNFQGVITFIDNEGNSIASGDMMDGVFYQTMSTGDDDYCETTSLPEFTPCYGQNCPCERGEGTWTTYEIVICDYLNGGGGSGGNYEVPWPPSHNGGGSGSSIRTNPYTYTEPVVPPLHNNILLILDLENLLGQPLTQEQKDWIRESKENYEFALQVKEALEENGEVDWDDKVILDSSFTDNDRVKCVYENMKGLSNTLFNSIINDHFDSSKNAHIKFEIGAIPDENNFSYNARTYPSYNSQTGARFYRIRLKTSFAENASTIEIALALIHEAIHAELLDRSVISGLILSIAPSGAYSFDNYPNPVPSIGTTLFNSLTIYYKNYGNGNPNWNHDQFNILGHRTAMAQNLESIHPWLDDQSNPLINHINSDPNINSLNDFYEFLSWEGLEETQEYKNLSMADQSKKSYVLQFAKTYYNQNCP